MTWHVNTLMPLSADSSEPAADHSLCSLNVVPADAFLYPDGQNTTQVKRLLTATLDEVLDTLSAARLLPPVPENWPGISTSQLLPAQPCSLQELIQASRVLLQGAMNPAHPRYLGHMDPLPSTASIAASLITAAVNNNLLSREMSPVFSDLEQRLLRELSALFGLPASSGGLMLSGGTLCNLQALTVARNTHFNVHAHGMSGVSRQPVLFASEACHSSIQKAAMILGLGTASVISILTAPSGKMCPSALEAAIALSRKNGQAPFAVVATAGTTVTGNIDPLPEIAEICQRERLWLHVDASYGGAVIFSPRYRSLLAGIDQADSITFNPQKWCYVTKTCALVLFREEQILDRAFRIPAPYMSLHEEAGHINLGEWGIQGTRAPDIAKWWLTLLQLGQAGLAELIEQAMRQTAQFLAQARRRDFLELATPPELNIVCLRDQRHSYDEISLGKQNTALQSYLMNEAQTFVSLPHYRESRWLKAVLLNPFTSSKDFDEIFQAIDRFPG